jgi:hypothetical protein
MITSQMIQALDARISALAPAVEAKSQRDSSIIQPWNEFGQVWEYFKANINNVPATDVDSQFKGYETKVTNWEAMVTSSPKIRTAGGGAGMFALIGIAAVLLILGKKG